MDYLQAIKECMKGNKIRCISMDKGEYIQYLKQEKRLLWWDKGHYGHWSYPQDVSDEDYQKWIFDKWIICNNIRPIKKKHTKNLPRFAEHNFG
jgi:hypothetical protein